MIRCAFCDSAMMALEINVTNAHVCPLCGAVFARRHGNTYSIIADLKGAQGVKELLHSMRPHDPLQRNISMHKKTLPSAGRVPGTLS